MWAKLLRRTRLRDKQMMRVAQGYRITRFYFLLVKCYEERPFRQPTATTTPDQPGDTTN